MPDQRPRTGILRPVDTTAGGGLRVLRAVLLALVVLATGTVAHAGAGGLLPGAPDVVALLLLVAAAAWPLLGREASARRLITATVVGQTLVHVALSALAGHAAVVPVGSHAAHATHAEPSWFAHGLGELVHQPAMALLHLLAAAAVGAWLRLGERALFALLRLGVASLRRLCASVPLALGVVPTPWRGATGVRARAASAPRPALPVWARGPVRRGPPRLLPAC